MLSPAASLLKRLPSEIPQQYNIYWRSGSQSCWGSPVITSPFWKQDITFKRTSQSRKVFGFGSVYLTFCHRQAEKMFFSQRNQQFMIFFYISEMRPLVCARSIVPAARWNFWAEEFRFRLKSFDLRVARSRFILTVEREASYILQIDEFFRPVLPGQ